MVGLNRSTVSVLLNYYRRGGILGGQGGMLVIYAVPARALLEQAGLLFCSRSNRGYGPVRPSERSDRA